MGKNILNFVASNFMADFRDTLRPYLLVFFGLVGSVALGYAIYLGFLLAQSEDNEKRKKAKKRILMTLSSLMIVIILTVVFVDWDPGEVFDRNDIALGRASNYALEQSVFVYQPNAKYPLFLTFREQVLDPQHVNVVWSAPTFKGPPQKTADITGSSTSFGWDFNYPGNTPPTPTEQYYFTATITTIVSGEVVTIDVPLCVQVYDPNYTSAPPPLRPQGEPDDVPLPQPGGGGTGGGGDPNIINPGTGGDYDFAWPVTGTPSHSAQVSSAFGPGVSGACAQCRARPGYSGHNGVDLVGGGAIFAMESGKIVNMNKNETITGPCGPSLDNVNCRHTDSAGNFVTLLHQDANGNAIKIGGSFVYSFYCHLAPNDPVLRALSIGTKIIKGQRLGTMGNTGHTVGYSGIHLHWTLCFSNSGTATGTSGMSKMCPISFY